MLGIAGGVEDAELYTVRDGNINETYMFMQGEWYKTADFADYTDMLSDYEKMLMMTDALQDMRVEPYTELIQGKAANHLFMNVDFQAVLARNPEVLSQVTGLLGGLDWEDLPSVQKPLLVGLSFYTDAETDEILRMQADMSDFMKKFLQAAGAPITDEMPVELTISMDLWDINAAPDFEIPPEALNATPVS